MYLNEGEISVAVHGTDLELSGKANSVVVDGKRMHKGPWQLINSYLAWVAVFITGEVAFLLRNFLGYLENG